MIELSQGIILFLNGVTSVGRTILAKAMPQKASINFYTFSNDTFQQMVSPQYLRLDAA